MNNKVVNVMMFSVGAAIGAVSTYMALKKRYEQILREEIESVKQVYSDRKEKEKENNDDVDEKIEFDEETHSEYENLASLYSVEEKGKIEDDIYDGATIIDPIEFGDDEEFEQVTLVFYADGSTATHDGDNLIENPAEYVGIDFENHFGEYGDYDTVYVKNDTFKTYFEIIKNEHRYSDPISMVDE